MNTSTTAGFEVLERETTPGVALRAPVAIPRPEKAEAPAKAAGPSVRSGRKGAIGVAAALAILGAAGLYGYHAWLYASTDNATIEARTTLLSARVGGIIVSSDVVENQQVKKGQVLARIRSAEYDNALTQARAERASIAAQLRNAETAFARTRGLFRQGAMTQERLDAAEAQSRSLEQKLRSADSLVNQAELNLADTQIRAPADGTIARKSFEIGMMASPGQPLLGFVAGDERWATANFKETEMKGVTPGKPATVEVDALSGRVFSGVVESISPSTGAIFSLLPPDNATGNFTKVVQRVPVRVKLTGLEARDIGLLQAGLSAEVTVKLH